ALYRHPYAQAFGNLVAHAPEHRDLLGPGSGNSRRVLQSPVNTLVVAREGRTAVARAVADRDDVVEPLTEEAFERLALLARNVDADLPHHLNSQRIDAVALGAGA